MNGRAMEFSIKSAGNSEVTIEEGLPPGLTSYAVNGAVAHSMTGTFGQALFQHIKGDGFTIWYRNYLIEEQIDLYVNSGGPLIYLHVLFGNHAEYCLEGLGNVCFSDGQFTITYMPFVNAKVAMAKGAKCNSFCIHFEAAFLEQFMAGSPELNAFVDKINANVPCNITPKDHYATIEMIRTIRRIISNEHSGEHLKLFTKSQVTTLMIEALGKISSDAINKSVIKLSTTDIEGICAVKDYLINKMDEPLSLIQLARKVGINDFKLKKGFKQIFGTTIFNYLENARLEKALILLKDTKHSIAQIAITLGFAYPAHFSSVFKKRFGYPPGHFRK